MKCAKTSTAPKSVRLHPFLTFTSTTQSTNTHPFLHSLHHTKSPFSCTMHLYAGFFIDAPTETSLCRDQHPRLHSNVENDAALKQILPRASTRPVKHARCPLPLRIFLRSGAIDFSSSWKASREAHLR